MVSLSSKQRHQIKRQLFLTLSIWGLGVAAGSYFGYLSRLSLPWLALLVVSGILWPVAVYYGTPTFRSYIQGLDLDDLTLFHLWRIPAAFVFFSYGHQHLLPADFVRNAAWGDLVAGLLVLVVWGLPKSNWKYWGFHLFGLADFVVAVGTGLTFSLLRVPMMETITTYPLALIPLFGVGISGASHLMALDILRQRHRQSSAT
ncbi:MAG: hypothetical protein ACTS3T_13085 [Almyronema sp.]